jgi:hypothetical protein
MQEAELHVGKASSEGLLTLLQRLPDGLTGLSITATAIPALPGDQEREHTAAGVPMLLGMAEGTAHGASPGLIKAQAVKAWLVSQRRAEQQAFSAAVCQKLLLLRHLRSLHLQLEHTPLLLDGCGEELLRGLPGLQHLSGCFASLDLASLPAGLTSLELYGSWELPLKDNTGPVLAEVQAAQEQLEHGQWRAVAGSGGETAWPALWSMTGPRCPGARWRCCGETLAVSDFYIPPDRCTT